MNPQQPGDRDHLETARETNVSRVSSYSLASIENGFGEIDPVQLSLSVKTTNATHTSTDTQTDKRTDGKTDYYLMGACTHLGMKRLFRPKGKKRHHYNTKRFA